MRALLSLPLVCGWLARPPRLGPRGAGGGPRARARRGRARAAFEPPKEWGYFDIADVMARKELVLDNPDYVPDMSYNGTMHPGTVGEERFGGAMDNAPWDALPVDFETGELDESLWIDDHAFFELPFYFRFPPNRPWEPSPAERLTSVGNARGSQ